MKIVKENDIYKTVKIGATYKAIACYKTLTINPVPSDAKVTFSKGIISGNTTTVDEGLSVTYSVSKNGYSTYTDTIIVSEDMTINVELQEGYPSGTVLFESGTPGTYTINVEANCTIRLDMCGAGGAGAEYYVRKYHGGSAGYIYGETELEKGTYTIIVGAANGGLSSFNENIAYGGGNATKNGGPGAGGTTSVVSLGLTGSNGSFDSSVSRILSYGGGGYGKNSSGQHGYCKIVTV